MDGFAEEQEANAARLLAQVGGSRLPGALDSRVVGLSLIGPFRLIHMPTPCVQLDSVRRHIAAQYPDIEDELASMDGFSTPGTVSAHDGSARRELNPAVARCAPLTAMASVDRCLHCGWRCPHMRDNITAPVLCFTLNLSPCTLQLFARLGYSQASGSVSATQIGTPAAYLSGKLCGAGMATDACAC